MNCVYPQCSNSSRTRGLCHGHYQGMREKVRAGKITEAELEERGLLTPKGQGGSPVTVSHAAFNRTSDLRGKPDEFTPVLSSAVCV